MKKYFLLILLIGGFFFLPIRSYATSGACSSHAGVNCNAGADWDGSVICNDGWKNSSVKYSDMVECAEQPKYYCTPEQYNELQDKYSIASLVKQAQDINIDIANVDAEYEQAIINNRARVASAESINSRELLILRQWEIEKNALISSQNSILNQLNQGEKSVNYECSLLGEAEHYNQLSNFLTQLQSLNTTNLICQENSYLVGDKCFCSDGYVVLNNKCVTYVAACQSKYGINSYGDKSFCYCTDGFGWNSERTACIKKTAINNKASKTNNNSEIDKKLAEKLKGKILLQVESHGEAWYVNPTDGARHYMADGDAAYNVMRNFGVGVTNKDLERIKSSKTFAKSNSGKIFLQVESHGEAYYVDFNGNAHYLKDGAAAYEVMRSLGLGITNNDLSKISEGSL